MKNKYDVIIVGSGPAGLGAAFYLAEKSDRNILLIDKAKISSGGLRNDCKQNYTFPVGFPIDLWDVEEANSCLYESARHLEPEYEIMTNVGIYKKRAANLKCELLEIKQSHVGTDKSVALITSLINRLSTMNTDVCLEQEMKSLDYDNKLIIMSDNSKIEFTDLIIAPGRAGFKWLQDIMHSIGVSYSDNIVDVGIRVELLQNNYPIVSDYYDPKFLFPYLTRTFCTNSRAAFVVKEKYENYYSVNGHSFSNDRKPNNLANFALLKTIRLTDPVVSGHQFAEILGQMAMKLSGGQPMMQRVGDFRLGKRSKTETFNDDLYCFEPTLKNATPGDISLAIPSKIMRDIWRSLKMLDTIVPGVLHPSTIMYYPEIKTYANKPLFIDKHFMVKNNIYMIGDGAGTSRGITAAWASGIRAARGIIE